MSSSIFITMKHQTKEFFLWRRAFEDEARFGKHIRNPRVALKGENEKFKRKTFARKNQIKASLSLMPFIFLYQLFSLYLLF
jgi:hypothetical protein